MGTKNLSLFCGLVALAFFISSCAQTTGPSSDSSVTPVPISEEPSSNSMDGAPVSLQELYANLQPGALENYLNKNPGAFQIETDPGFKFTAIVKPSEDFQADYSLGEIVKIIPVCKGDNVAVTMFMNGKESGSGECSTPSIAWTIPADFELKNPVFRFETPGADYAEIAIFQKSDGTYCW